MRCMPHPPMHVTPSPPLRNRLKCIISRLTNRPIVWRTHSSVSSGLGVGVAHGIHGASSATESTTAALMVAPSPRRGSRSTRRSLVNCSGTSNRIGCSIAMLTPTPIQSAQSMRRQLAQLPLHTGAAPAYLFQRMWKLAGAITMAVVDEYGPAEMLRRLSDPWWFQAFGCVLGFDWHSSGVTTVTCGALKEAYKHFGNDLGIL